MSFDGQMCQYRGGCSSPAGAHIKANKPGESGWFCYEHIRKLFGEETYRSLVDDLKLRVKMQKAKKDHENHS